MYKIIRNFLFKFDPERVHYFSMSCLHFLCGIGFLKKIITGLFSVNDQRLQREVWGIKFKNPVGLGAGFDKNAQYLHELEALGFGFVEIGTVTPRPQDGNEKPRLFRLPKDKALINRMGFNNQGVEVIAQRLQAWKMLCQQRPDSVNLPMIIGGNIGKNKLTPNEDAWQDYETCFKMLFPYVDYFVVNVSSPNTPGLRELQGKDALRKILTNLQNMRAVLQSKQVNAGGGTGLQKPILLKIAPDLTSSQIDDVIDLAMEIQLDGLVATNTTISREGLLTNETKVSNMGAGGLSGLPVKKRSTEVVAYICQQTNGKIPVMASGGIFTGSDAMEKIKTGAPLVQVWTGFIYVGPAIVKNICKYLLKY